MDTSYMFTFKIAIFNNNKKSKYLLKNKKQMIKIVSTSAIDKIHHYKAIIQFKTEKKKMKTYM